MEYVVYFLMIFATGGNVETFPVEFPDKALCDEAIVSISHEFAKSANYATGGYKTYVCVPIKKM